MNISITNSSRMINLLFDLNYALTFLGKIKRYDYMSNFENNINNLKTKINLYKIKILSFIKLNDKY